MKITITGHSAGIGKALSGLYPEHIGFSPTNGFDISIPEHRAMILSQSKDSDVFVNNAHNLDHQTMMFEEVFEEWLGWSAQKLNDLLEETGLDVPPRVAGEK